MYDMNPGIICVEKPRHKDVSCRFWRKSGKDLRFRHRLHLTIQESSTRRTLFAVGSFVSSQLLVVLFLMLIEVILDFRKLSNVRLDP
jgi:hypothetical protein